MGGIELLVAGVLGVMGHLKSKEFVSRRLRYTDLVEKPGLGLGTGVATAVVVAVAAPVLPFVGAATAVALGAGVGTGVSLGAAQARRGGPSND